MTRRRTEHQGADPAASLPEEGRLRAVIETVFPEVDGGRFACKHVAGEPLAVEADVFCDGHDVLRARLLWRRQGESSFHEVEMAPLPNDRWRGAFPADEVGRYEYTVAAWVDRFATWRHDFAKKVEAGQDEEVDRRIGAALLEDVAERAARAGAAPDVLLLRKGSAALASSGTMEDGLAVAADRHPDRRFETRYPRLLVAFADPPIARASSWYEMFPRSTAPDGSRHGTLADCEKRLPYVASMGFDVVYLPPIHPIGVSKRKGPNNAEAAGPEDLGSPWAIGARSGGHTAIHPDLGTFEEFDRFVARARGLGLQVALDVAFQCSPDHPWIAEHPEWFRRRPDGTIQYAENPPKKYQDIYPFDFESDDWRALWSALRGVFEFWIERGVSIFRVDNPHTKAFAFWEWVIADLRSRHPRTLFLAEAFTRPKTMARLAKLGFTHSYTYFTWRNTREEIESYFTELSDPAVRQFFRPHLWPNTPDILPEGLQIGGRPAFAARFLLAATLGASYGIYGPAFELCEGRPLAPGREEYLDSEKYQIREWNLDDPGSLRPLISRMNRIRRENPALLADASLRFHGSDNPQIVVYSRRTADRTNTILVVVNLDPHHRQQGFTDLDLGELGVRPDESFQVHDLLTDARYLWTGSRNYVELDPHQVPAHVLRVRRKMRTEQDFDYYL